MIRSTTKSDFSQLRTDVLSLRNQFSKDFVNASSRCICNKLLERFDFSNQDAILGYYPLGNEVDLTSMYQELLQQQVSIYFPKTNQTNMQFYQVKSLGELEKGNFNVYEPTNCQENRRFNITKKQSVIALIPGVVFDKTGNRIGFGKGYYDKFLAENPEVMKIGICYQEQLQPSWKPNQWDVSMDYIFTQDKMYQM